MMRKVIILLLLCVASEAGGQSFALSTNIANGVTMNIEASCALSRHISIEAGTRYRPYERADNRERTFSTGLRWWPWHVFSGWWILGKAQWQEFSENMTELKEGDRIGITASAGYSWMISKRLNLDFGVSLWTGYERCLIYDCGRCGRLKKNSEGLFARPDEWILGISYVF